MKIAFSVKEPRPDSMIDSQFGRGKAFVFFDTETGNRSLLPNPFAQVRDGAGTGAALMMIEQGVDVVISGSFGSKAARVLGEAEVSMYRFTSGTVIDNLPVMERERKR